MINPRAKELHWITGFSKNENFGKKEQRSRNRTLTCLFYVFSLNFKSLDEQGHQKLQKIKIS